MTFLMIPCDYDSHFGMSRLSVDLEGVGKEPGAVSCFAGWVR